jgi:periplasmic protein TonB
MFEDSTFESTGRIQTRSRSWMIAAFTLNGSILMALVLIPLVFPDALPHQMMPTLVVAPAAPAHKKPPVREVVQRARGASEMPDGHLVAPSSIPILIKMTTGPEVPFANTALTMDQGSSVPGGGENLFGSHRPVAVVAAAENKGPVRVSSMVVAGLLILKNVPQYPPIAKAMGVQGTVVLEATISKSGTIENLRVASGPTVLQQAAMDAVKTWRYRPYMLNHEPVEVETSVNVVFTMAH